MLKAKLLYYRTAFLQLSGSRQYTQTGSALPIPISEYAAYCQMFDITSLAEKERLFEMVRAQDRTYVEHSAEKVKEQMAENAKHSKSAVARG